MANLRTVAATGADHTSVGAAVSWMQTNHDFDTDGIATIRIIDNAEYNENITISGISGTASATAYLKLEAASANRHSGKAGTVHARIRGSTNTSHVITVSISYTWIYGLEIQQDSTGSSDEGIRFTSGVVGGLVSNCIVWTDQNISDQDGIYTGNWSADLCIDNTIIYGFNRTGIHAQNHSGSASQTINSDHNTIIKCGAAGEAESGGINSTDFSSGSNTINTYNTYCGDTASTYGDFSETGDATTWNGDYNSASDTTAIGTNAVDSVAVNTTNFVNITAGSEDYTLPGTGSALYNAGTDRQGSEPDSRQDFSVDIAGNARGTTNVDIGAFEYVTGGTTVSPGVGSLSLTGNAPIISITNNITIDIPVASINLTGYQPIVNSSGGVTVDIPIGNLSLLGLAPGILTPVGIDVPVAALQLQGFLPTVDTTILINIPAATLTLTGLVPTVTTTRNQLIDVPAANFSLTGFPPTIVGSNPISINVPVATLLLTGLMPSIDDGAIWTVKSHDDTNWTLQSEDATTWTIQ